MGIIVRYAGCGEPTKNSGWVKMLPAVFLITVLAFVQIVYTTTYATSSIQSSVSTVQKLNVSVSVSHDTSKIISSPTPSPTSHISVQEQNVQVQEQNVQVEQQDDSAQQQKNISVQDQHVSVHDQHVSVSSSNDTTNDTSTNTSRISVQEHDVSVQEHNVSVQEHNVSVQEHNVSVQELNVSVQEHNVSVSPSNDTANITYNASQSTDTSSPIPTWSQELRDQLVEDLRIHGSVAPRFVYVGEDPILSRILSNGQLVVPVNQAHALWYDGQARLCRLLRNMTLTSSLPPMLPLPLPSPIINMTFDCEEIERNPGFGQGNWVTAIYAARLPVAYAKMEFHYQTLQQDAHLYETTLLPWFQVIQPAPTDENPWPFDGGMPPDDGGLCSAYRAIRVDRMAREIQRDLRAMAWQIVAPPPHLDATKDAPEIPFPAPFSRIPNITLDDVALHFRCGDIMGGAKRNDFGIIKFTEYPKWIYPNTTSIGILTQPFDKGMVRRQDAGKTEDCRQAVYLLVDYLQSQYPNATVTIRNSREETIPLTYARLVMAKQAFTSLSSFGIFPVVATYGDGYFQRGNKGCNPFAGYFAQHLPNLHEMTAPIKGSWEIAKMGLNATLAWFVNDTDGRRR